MEIFARKNTCAWYLEKTVLTSLAPQKLKVLH